MFISQQIFKDNKTHERRIQTGKKEEGAGPNAVETNYTAFATAAGAPLCVVGNLPYYITTSQGGRVVSPSSSLKASFGSLIFFQK